MSPDAPQPRSSELPALIADLRADLTAADYTVEGVHAVLGVDPGARDMVWLALERDQLLPARRALRGRTEPAAVLAGVFMLGQGATRAALDAALPRAGVAGALRLGLLAADGPGAQDEVRAAVDLRPYSATDAAGDAAWWVVSDLGEVVTGQELGVDHVLGIGGASTTLAQSTVRTPVGSVLDVGTGCGVQALHASRHARRIVATDTSERALDLAAVNAALNGLELDLRAGSLLEPVRPGERFDLVVSNPPFVITPRTGAVPTYEYRDGGMAGDSLVATLVGGLEDVLAPGGVAQLLANWELREGEDWREHVEAWIPAGLDAWVVQREVADPALYAETWIRDGGTHPGRARPGGPDFEALYGAWLDDFAARDITRVGFGILTLRRPLDPARPRLRRFEEALQTITSPLGEVFAAGLAAHDALAGLDDAALLDRVLTVAPDVTDERFHTPGEPDPRVILLRQGGGWQRAVQAGSDLAAVVGACDGELTVGQIVAGLAVLTDRDPTEVAAGLVASVRDLVGDGLLLLDRA
ncbi:methyltransferase [Kineococcus gynurae]|uniref:Methyltransferase n=1 Tax=Kineococcus gynurae TaxID=452979 RepID=A0ABV5LU07_9ACTN